MPDPSAMHQRHLHDPEPARLSLRTSRALLLAVVVGACRPSSGAAVDARPAEPISSTAPAPAPAPSSTPAPAPSVAPDRLPDVATEWCLDDFKGLDEGTCYLMGERPRRLLIYLSGIVPPAPRSLQKEKVQRIVAAAARAEGDVAVLLPRGRRGIGPKDAKDWWAWPTGPTDYARYANELVAEWRASRARLEAALGRPFERVYLAGSSSGGYFLAALALSGLVEMDGYMAASGGSPGLARAVRDAGVRKRPFYVGYGAADPTNGGPKSLAAFL